MDKLLENLKCQMKNGPKEFLVKIYRYLKWHDPAYADIDVYEKAEKEKGNFSNALNGKRPLNKDYLLPIEAITGLSLLQLSGEDSSASPFVKKGIRYVASLDDYKEYCSLFEEKTEQGSDVWENYDEYDNNLLTYIFLYQSLNGLKALHEAKGAAVNYFDNKSLNVLGGLKEQAEGVLSLICLKDSPEVFNGYFDLYRSFIECRQSGNWLGILSEEADMNRILNAPNVLKEVLKFREISIKELNPHMVGKADSIVPLANPYTYHLLRFCLSHCGQFQNQTKEILRFAIDYNEKAKRYFNANPGLAYCHIGEDGSVMNGIALCGNIIAYKLEAANSFDRETEYLLELLNDSISQIKFADKPESGGMSRKEVRVKNGNLVKVPSGNQTEYEFLKSIEPFGLSFIPKLISHGKEGDTFTYVKGRSLPYDYSQSCPLENIKQVMEAIKKKDEASKKLLGNGKVYVHGDLSPRNIIFDNGRLSGFIDWDTTHIGEEYEDFAYALWQLLNIGNLARNNETLYERFKIAVSYYGPSAELRSGFAEKLLKAMDNALESTRSDDPNYQRIFEWVGWSKIWVNLYKERITKDIG